MYRGILTAIALMLFVASPSYATTYAGVGDMSCLSGNVAANTSSGSVLADMCIGRMSGNDAKNGGYPLMGMLNDDDVFGDYDWVFMGKSDEGDFYADENKKSGTWSLLSGALPINGPFAISFKHGNGFSVYFFENALAVTSGTFSLPGSGRKNKVFALSHASLFITTKVTSIPLPAASLLFGAGLFGYGLMRRRQKSGRGA